MRVAIVNDQRLATEALRQVVCSDPRYQIAWTAEDGEQAVRRCEQDVPDVILMDLVMPVMNGAEATRRIMQRCPCAVLVVTATVAGNFGLVCEALGHGAYDAVCTPCLGDRSPAEAGAELLNKLGKVERLNQHLKAGGASCAVPSARQASIPARPVSVPIVAIGSSTGGPPALARILSGLPATFPAAVLIAQHIGQAFAPGLVSWLNEQCSLPVKLAARGDALQPGTVFLAATEDHLILGQKGYLNYTAEPRNCPYRPSVDVLFQSLAASGLSRGIAVILTGLGRDGAQGMLALRRLGWHTIAQDQASCASSSMPQAACQLGAVERVLPLGDMACHLVSKIQQLSRATR
jgi:two-component system response regulator WspF